MDVLVVLQALELFGLSVPVLLLLAGTGLIVAEAFAPGAHFIVLGVALLVAGLVGVLLGPLLGGLLTLFVMTAAVLVAGTATFYAYRELDIYGGKGSAQTSDSDSLRGKTGRVTDTVSTSGGEVKLDEGGFNPFYQARTVDGEIPEGAEVMVVDPGGGNVITVEATSSLHRRDDIDRELERELERDREERDETDREGDAETV